MIPIWLWMTPVTPHRQQWKKSKLPNHMAWIIMCHRRWAGSRKMFLVYDQLQMAESTMEVQNNNGIERTNKHYDKPNWPNHDPQIRNIWGQTNVGSSPSTRWQWWSWGAIPEGSGSDVGEKHGEANLSWMDTEFSLRQVLLPKLLYPLMTTNFTEEQCQEILRPALTSTLPAMGINWHFPRAVIHGPKSHQGLGIPNLYMEQLCAHIVTLLRFGPQPNDPTSHLINANAKAFWLEAGLAGTLFQCQWK